MQASFLDEQEELRFTDLALFNHALVDWLVFCNTERPVPAPRTAHLSSLLQLAARGPKALAPYNDLTWRVP